jgi:hypothetical protein
MSQPAPFKPSSNPYAAGAPRDSGGSGGVILVVIAIAALLLLVVLGGAAAVAMLMFARATPVASPKAVARAPMPAPVPTAPVRPAPPPLPEEPPMAPTAPGPTANASRVDFIKNFAATGDMRVGFQLQDGMLVTSRDRPAKMLLGHAPGESYDLEIEMLRRDSTDGMIVGIIVDGHQAMINVDGFPPAGYRSGLDQIDGHRINSPQNPATVSGKLLPENTRQTLLIQVRGQHVTASLGGKTFVDWQGSGQRLSVFPLFKTPDDKQMFLGTWDSVYEFTKVELRPAM